mmetsp:Transcript_20870/g.67588  ORF Transcript_20870/g.67588 Transcript_20870/m.67588 type:complete len:151 (+) Transcript_20870:162-614(+)
MQTAPSGKAPLYLSAFDCAAKTARKEGVRGFYAGVTSPLAGQMAFRAFLFASFGQARALVLSGGAEGAAPTTKQLFTAGVLGWGAATLVEGPLDLYKSQMQKQLNLARADPSHRPEFRSMHHCFLGSFKISGFRAPYSIPVRRLLRCAGA